jgi:dUTP pyrophosphatase
VILRVKKLRLHAKLPEYKSRGACGLDLYASEEVRLAPKEWKAVATGIAVEIPSGFEGQVRARSGLALNNGIGVLNSPGTIDSDYRGEIKVILFNFSESEFNIQPGMRIAQLVISKVYRPKVVESELSTTKRGKNGFGSTGR